MTRTPVPLEEDDLDELPPLDGETEAGEADFDLDELDDNGDDGLLDDVSGEEQIADAHELEIDHDATSWLDEPADAHDLDLGDVGLVDLSEDGAEADDADALSPVDDETSFIEGAQRAGLDGGDEGPIDADEELRDEDLPALDADDEAESSEVGFVDDRFAADEPLGLPWSSHPWARVGAPLGLLGATAIACAGKGALVCGHCESSEDRFELVHVDLEGARRVLPAEGLGSAAIRSLTADPSAPDRVAVVLRSGRVAVSADGGGRFDARADGTVATDVVAAGGDLWVRTRAGALVVCPFNAPDFEACPLDALAAALIADGGKAVALVIDEAGRASAVVRCLASGRYERESFAPVDVRAPALFAVRGNYIACAGRSGVVRRGEGGVWNTFAWEGRVTALSFVDDDGTLIAATYSDADDTTGLVRIDPAGDASIVARIGSVRDQPGSDGRALGMACDDARGVIWVAGGFGIAAFAVAPR